MKKIMCIVLALLGNQLGWTQVLKPIALQVKQKELQGDFFSPVQIFRQAAASEIAVAGIPEIEGAEVLMFNPSSAEMVLQFQPANIIFKIPQSSGGLLELKLFRSTILSQDFSVTTSESKGESEKYDQGLHYWGIINGDMHSIAAISIYKDEIMGLVSTDQGNFVLGKINNDSQGVHIFYNDRKLPEVPSINCSTLESGGDYTPVQLARNANLQTINCVRLYWEASHDIYVNKGSFAATTNYLIGLFNQSALLYANDGVNVLMSELFIWTTPSPYSGTSSFDYLNAFQNFRPVFNGDLGHMLDYNSYGGVAATIGGLCSFNNDNRHCYSGISSGYFNVPAYSWSVMVVTHEQGHLMGSRHTHACVWNGNGTSIDGCGTSQGYVEGNCVQGPIPPTGGTVMSYCHLTTVGINLSDGFGPQPASVIVNSINNSSCLSSCSPVSCSTPTGLSVSGITNNAATVSWLNDPNAIDYIIEYHATGTTLWDTLLVSASPVTIANLTAGAAYSWQVQSRCTEGLTFFSAPDNFVTIPLACSTPIGLTNTGITSTSVLLAWQPVSGAQAYIVQYSITGSGIWAVDTIASSTYLVSGLIPSENYEWQVQTWCNGGAVSAWSVSGFFTTSLAGAATTLILQPDAGCGKDALITTCLSCPDDSTNHGMSEEIFAQGWASGSSPTITRSLLQFDLTSIPIGSVVQSALVSLYYDPATAYGQHSGTNSGYLLKVTSPWDENTVTWNNQPSTTIIHNAAIPASTLGTQDYPTINAKNMVQYFVNNPSANYGMMLKLLNEQPYGKLIFASSDHPNPALHPKLIVTYTPPADSCISLQYASCNGQDAMLSSCMPCGYDTLNYGTGGELDALAWTDQGNATYSRALLKWDLSFIPANATVQHAGLSLFAYNSPTNGQHAALSGSNEAVLNKVTSPWDEYSVNWNTMPSVSTTNQVTLPASISPSQDYLNTDVTVLVQDMVANAASNYGLMLQLVTEQDFRKLVFASSDNNDPSKHPRLEICYTVPTAVPKVENNQISLLVKQDVKNKTISFGSIQGFLPGTMLQIYNVAGQLICSKTQLTGNATVISTAAMARGVYMYRLLNTSYNATGKLIIY